MTLKNMYEMGHHFSLTLRKNHCLSLNERQFTVKMQCLRGGTSIVDSQKALSAIDV